MKKTILISFVLLHFTVFSNAQEKNFIDQNYIDVTGKIEQQIEPDEIYISIQLNEHDFKKGVKIEDKEIKMVSTLNDLGINTKEKLRVINFSGNYQHFLLKKNDMVKNKSYQLLINDNNKLGYVFEALDNLDITRVSISKVDHSKIEELKFALKAKAIKIAKKKAESYAKALDQQIGKALFIKETNNHNYQNNNYLSNAVLQEVVITGYSTSEKREFPQLSIQKITISTSVEVKFELK